MFRRPIEWGLNNRLLVVVAATALIAAGAVSFGRLPVDAFPDVSPNLVQVFTVTEGLAPEEVEKFVTYPVEVSMTGLPGVERIRSVSNSGLSVVNVYFSDDLDIYFARQLVGERLREARERIPAGFGEPEMGPISTGMGLVLFYYLEDTTGERSLEELRTLQDWVVKPNLQTVSGVTEVLGIGGYERQYHVVVHPEELLRYDVTLDQMIARIDANNLNVGAQFLEKNGEEFVVRSVGLARTRADLESIVMKTENGRPIFLRDLADVEIGGAVRRGLQTRNGEDEVVAGMVVKLYGANSSAVIARVEDRLATIDDALPEGVRIVPYYEQKSLVEAAVGTVTDALVQGIALVAIVLLAFMGGLRPSLVVGLAIPFSVCFAFVAMGRLGLSANLMSLGGLAIAIGMMVDGTIVLVENVDRALRAAGPDAKRHAVVLRAAGEVVRPIVFALAIIILVFLPLFTLQGVEGKTFRPLAIAVALAMFGSLVFVLVFAPAIADLLLRRGGGDEPAREPWIVRILLVPYRPLVDFFVRRRAAAVALGLVMLTGGAVVYPRLGSEFTPRLREGTVVVRLTLAPSIALEESKRMTMIVERRLVAMPEIREVVTRIGRGEVGAHADPVNSAEMFVVLEEGAGRVQERIEDRIRRELEDVPGVMVNLTQPIEMSVDELLEGVRAELAIKLFGDDLDALREHAGEVASVVRTVPGATDVQVDQVTGSPQILIRIDRDAIARHGLNVADVQRLVQAAVGGAVAGQVFEDVRRFDILVRFEAHARDTIEAIRELLVTRPEGGVIPLDELATVREIVGPRQITRENTQRFITVQCNVVDRDIGSFVDDAKKAIDDDVTLPAGYLLSWGGQFRLQQEANRRLAVVVPVTMLLAALLLFASFGSLRSAALIMANVPLALVGGIGALWLAGENLSVPASVGFIALLGIALENGMVLVSDVDARVRAGTPIDQASVEGACRRLRPVLMTAITTGLGLAPLLVATGTGSEVQRPLATVVVGGLVTSTVLTLVVIPALYRTFRGRTAI